MLAQELVFVEHLLEDANEPFLARQPQQTTFTAALR